MSSGQTHCAQHIVVATDVCVLCHGFAGTVAMADLSSNSTSLRLIMTTRAKLAEVTTALTAAAAAAAKGSSTSAAAQSASSSRGSGSPAAAAESAVVTALPLQPWAWPWSAQCGCKGSSSSNSGGGAGPGQQVLRVQHPPLRYVLQEMANTAASIHRRVMIYLRSQEAAMQS
jgi:hypothetical protein